MMVDGPPMVVLNYMVEKFRNQHPNVPHVSSSEFSHWLETPEERTVVLLDARDEESFEISHIPDAIRIGFNSKTPEEVVEICEEKLKDKPNPTIVVFCYIGGRSCQVASDLITNYDQSGKQPRPEIFNLEGCLFKWANERRPMVDGKGHPTQVVHLPTGAARRMVEKELWHDKEEL